MRDDSAPLRKALCDAARLDDSPDNAERAMAQLAQEQPQELRRLLQQHLAGRGDVALALLDKELACLGVRVDQLEAGAARMDTRLSKVEGKVDALLALRDAQAHAAPLSLPAYMLTYWEERWQWRLKKSVTVKMLISKMVAWFNDEG